MYRNQIKIDQTINYIGENISTKLMDLNVRDNFMILTPKPREVKVKINEKNYIN